MGINNTLVPIKIISPQLIQQVLPGQYPALMGQQFPQYFKFLLCQFKISSVHCGGVAVTVQTQIAIGVAVFAFLGTSVIVPLAVIQVFKFVGANILRVWLNFEERTV